MKLVLSCTVSSLFSDRAALCFVLLCPVSWLCDLSSSKLWTGGFMMLFNLILILSTYGLACWRHREERSWLTLNGLHLSWLLLCCWPVLSFSRDAGVGHSGDSGGGIGCGVESRGDVAWCLESGGKGRLGQRHRIRYQVDITEMSIAAARSKVSHKLFVGSVLKHHWKGLIS